MHALFCSGCSTNSQPARRRSHELVEKMFLVFHVRRVSPPPSPPTKERTVGRAVGHCPVSKTSSPDEVCLETSSRPPNLRPGPAQRMGSNLMAAVSNFASLQLGALVGFSFTLHKQKGFKPPNHQSTNSGRPDICLCINQKQDQQLREPS